MGGISVLIPCLGEDEEQLRMVVGNLTDGQSPDELEILFWNDGSINSDGTPKPILRENIPWSNVKILNSPKRMGVGHGFDRMAEKATGDILLIQGADVYVERRKWLESIKNVVRDDELGCSCSVGLQPGNYDINFPGLYYRYGARILYTMTVDDLPKNSTLRKFPDYKDILESKWLPKQGDDPYEVPCVLGACYWIKKDLYLHMRGFDTITGTVEYGHRWWGCLEPFLSLKARVYGAKCVVYPDIRAGHVFGRLDEAPPRANKADYKIWNKLWVAHTLLDDDFRDEVVSFLPFSRNQSQANVWISQNREAIEKVRQRNKRLGNLIKNP